MRFAVLLHDHPFLHWDVLLQTGETCRTWRLLDSPESTGPWRAEAIADHRLFYLDHEGPVSGGRGHVTAWDRGEIVWIAATRSHVRVLCRGTKWHGVLTLRQQTDCHWQAEFTADHSVGC
ncbi:MAG TPA: DNA polymerase ligase N-terminal domain-containing protein [Planctomycetaceae bacterium]|nr:DNA polymerase ligase N-terminal domain-containing protein [Planctomycetaceae bacterium]